MADYAIPKSGVAYILYTGLVSQADTKLLKSSPALAAGDFKVSIDGGAFNNLTTLPTNTPGGTSVKISLSAAEMTGDNIVVACIDAAGAEWCDQYINIQTSPVGLNDVATAVWSVGTRTLTSFGTLVADTSAAVWAAGTRELTGFGTLVADIWTSATRTLTSYGTLTTDTATAVWASGTRTLTTFGTLVADTTAAVWAAGTRELTGFGTLVADVTTAVWGAGARTLTSFGTLVADVATAVWGSGVRTLTAFGFTPTPSNAADTTAILANTNYPDDCVFLDTVNGVAGTVVGVNGTISNPSNTFVNAAAIATSRGVKRVKFAPLRNVGMEILTGSYSSFDIDLNGGNLVLDNNATIVGYSVIYSSTTSSIVSSNVGVGQTQMEVASDTRWENISFNNNLLIEDFGYFSKCVLGLTVSPLTVALAGAGGFYAAHFQDCYTAIPNGLLTFDCGGGVDLLLNGWYGDFTITNLAAGTTVQVYGYAAVTIDASCTGGIVRHDSHVEITDNSGGAVTIDLVSEETGITSADVNAEMLDVLTIDTFPEETGVPPATTSLLKKINWLFMWMRNKSTETATQRKLFADNTTTVVSTEAVNDDGTTFTKGEAS